MVRLRPSDTMSGPELQSARERTGMTQAQLAAAAGCSELHISKLELGMGKLGTGLCIRIRQALQGSEGSLNPPPFGRSSDH